MLKRRALATSTVVFGFLVAASCGDSSDTGDGGGGKGGSGDAGEAGDGSGGTAGTGTGGATGGTAGSVTGGTAGTTSGSGGEPSDGGEPGDGGMPGDGGEPGGGEPGTGGTMAGSGGAGAGAGGMAGKAGSGGSGGMPITCPTADQLPAAWAQHVCTKNVDCCTGTDPNTCPGEVQAGILRLYPGLAASVAANQAAINCDDFIACMTAINNAACPAWPKELGSNNFGIPVDEPKCRTFIRGLVQSGTATSGNPTCSQDYQCINGHCTDPDSTAGTQTLQCIQFRGSGMSCLTTPDAQAEANMACNPVSHFCSGPANSDTQGQCFARFDDGATCTSAAQCESRTCVDTAGTLTCVKPTSCFYIPEPPPSSCSVSNAGGHKSSLAWLAIAGFIGLGAMGRRRRRR